MSWWFGTRRFPIDRSAGGDGLLHGDLSGYLDCLKLKRDRLAMLLHEDACRLGEDVSLAEQKARNVDQKLRAFLQA